MLKLIKALLVGFIPLAVEDKYVNANTEAGKKATALESGGGNAVCLVGTEEIAAADDDGSVYRFFKAVPAEYVPLRLEVYNDAITAGTDYDIGLYEVKDDNGNGGAVVDKDKFADGLDMSSGAAKGSPKDGLSAIGIDEVAETLWELAGHTISTRKPAYDIALTANTVGSAAGTISMVGWFAQG